MTNHLAAGRLLVGFDGRWQGTRSLDVAAAEAVKRGLPLSVVTLIHDPEEVASPHGRPADGRHQHKIVRQRLDEAARHVLVRRSSLRVATHLVTFSETVEEREPFTSAALLVIGGRGNHDVPAFSPGSASRRLTVAVSCPVMVVPDAGPATIVVKIRSGLAARP